MRNMVANRAAVEAHVHPSSIDQATDQTDFLTALKSVCRRHWDITLTDALQHTSQGDIRQDSKHCRWTYFPKRTLDTSVIRLRVGHTHLITHMKRLGMTDAPYCPWCPTQPDTLEHLLLHCPHHHSHHLALLHSITAL